MVLISEHKATTPGGRFTHEVLYLLPLTRQKPDSQITDHFRSRLTFVESSLPPRGVLDLGCNSPLSDYVIQEDDDRRRKAEDTRLE